MRRFLPNMSGDLTNVIISQLHGQERIGPTQATAIQSLEEIIMNSQSRITIDPNICHGKPTIRGLRYPVETILELLSSGMTTDDVLADYEDLQRDDILALSESTETRG